MATSVQVTNVPDRIRAQYEHLPQDLNAFTMAREVPKQYQRYWKECIRGNEMEGNVHLYLYQQRKIIFCIVEAYHSLQTLQMLYIAQDKEE